MENAPKWQSFNDLEGSSWLGSFAQRARRRLAYEGGSVTPAAWRNSPPRRAGTLPPPRAALKHAALKQTSLLRFLPQARSAPASAPPEPAASSPAAAPAEADEPPWWCAHGGAHALLLAELLAVAMRRDGGLLSADERGWIEAYLALPVAERALYARFFARKPPVFRLCHVVYREVPDARAAARSLASARLLLLVNDVAAESDSEAVGMVISCLNGAELRELAAFAGVPASCGARREQLVDALRVRLGLTQPAARVGTPGRPVGAAVLGRLAQPRALLRRLSELAGSVAILTSAPLRAFERSVRLVAPLGGDGGGGLACIAAAEMGVLRFPTYRTWDEVLEARARAAEAAEFAVAPSVASASALPPAPSSARAHAASATAPLFATRAALDRHERACGLALRYEERLAARDLRACDQIAAHAAGALWAIARRCARAAGAPVPAPAEPAAVALDMALAAAAAGLPEDAPCVAALPAPAASTANALPGLCGAADATGGLDAAPDAELAAELAAVRADALECACDEAEGWVERWRVRPAAASLAPGCALCSILTVHALVASRRTHGEIAAELCATMLLSPFGGIRRGLWWTRLLIDGARARALGAAQLEAATRCALADERVRTGERLGLLRRARKMAAAAARARARLSLIHI